ncbi:DUF6383 domain-containing protein [Parabacteroides chinchillae]|uniref:DUF6383 domain-containing protein n=1 Tax=Parabacteroides chinchillae TaxID=871327 RepID=A0A8G2F4C8_9BACT|nr:DUF6383 domain-containing protein [Parabacteroides chinchillae]SEF65417.1 hypothetical protein SAMN05444001_10455 [Parabacteroides chinchillae]
MNKRFSTLLATALVAGGLSANAQSLYYSSLNDLKDGTRVQLADPTSCSKEYTNAFVVESNDGLTLASKKLNSRATSFDLTADIDTTSYAGVDSTLWTVNVKVSGTARSYTLKNTQGVKLIVPSVTNSKDGNNGKLAGVKFVASGIDEWAYDGKCFYAFKNDSVFYLTYESDQLVLNSVKGTSASALSGVTASLVVRHPQESLTLTAKDFNAFMKKFGGKMYFNQSEVKDAPQDVNQGKNILTEKTWTAYQANVKSTANADSIPAVGQKSWGVAGSGLGKLVPSVDDADSLLVLWSATDKKALVVDTTYLKGSFAPADTNMVIDEAVRMPAWTLALADTVPTFGVNPLAGEQIVGGKVNRPIGSAVFVVKVSVANDSIAIRPYNLPKFDSQTNAFSDSLVADFTMQEGATKMVAGNFTVPAPALRVLGSSVYLVMDTANNNTSFYPLIQPYKAGDVPSTVGANIDVKKVYTLKYLDGDNKDKYAVAPFTAAALTGSAAAVVADAVEETDVNAQFVVKKLGEGIYEIINRATGNKIHSGFVGAVEGKDDTFTISAGTIQLTDAKVSFSGDKDYSGYLFYEAAKLPNIMFQVTSAYEYLGNMYLQGNKEGKVILADDESAMYLEKVNAAAYGAAKTDDVPQLYRQSYKMKDKDGKYLVRVENGQYTMKATSADYKATDSAAVFLIKACAKDQYQLVDTAGFVAMKNDTKAGVAKAADYVATNADYGYKVAILDAQAAAPALDTIALASSSKVAPFVFKEMAAPAVNFKAEGHQVLKSGNDMLAIGKNNVAVVAQEGNSLKAESFTKDDFTFYFDTVNYKAGETASYYVSKAIATESETKVLSGERMYMWAAKDSLNSENPVYKYSGAARLMFRPAERYGVDSLFVTNTDRDTVSLVAGTSKDATQGKILPGINNFRFILESDRDNEGSFFLKTADNKYVSNINGYLVVDSPDAVKMSTSLVTVDTPTGNESTEANTISVVAGEGNVTVYGAAGKKVIVSNVLGQKTTIVATSDSEVIAAPQGVVIVAVEGEAAVKAVVK